MNNRKKIALITGALALVLVAITGFLFNKRASLNSDAASLRSRVDLPAELGGPEDAAEHAELNRQADALAAQASNANLLSQLSLYGVFGFGGASVLLLILPGKKSESAYSRLKREPEEPPRFDS